MGLRITTPMPSLDELKRQGLISEHVIEQSFADKGMLDLCTCAPGYRASDEEIELLKELVAKAVANKPE